MFWSNLEFLQGYKKNGLFVIWYDSNVYNEENTNNIFKLAEL